MYTFTVDWRDDGDLVIWVGGFPSLAWGFCLRVPSSSRSDKTESGQHMRHASGLWRVVSKGKYIRDMRIATVYDDSSNAWGVKKPVA